MTQLAGMFWFDPEARAERSRVHEQILGNVVPPARVHVGGDADGEPLLLVHGGWGGATMHWDPVLAPLADRFRVIAPDLPGIGRVEQRALSSVADYAAWLASVLDALDVGSAWCVGNSFGASVVSRFASDYPERCRGLVLVNGFPMPGAPRLLRWLGHRRAGKRMLRAVEKRVAYTPRAIEKAFYDESHVPRALRELVTSAAPPQLEAMTEVLVEGDGARPRRIRPLLLWGEDDHLPGTTAAAARKLQARWPGAELAFVPHAGHLPQVENPGAFVDALSRYVRSASRAAE